MNCRAMSFVRAIPMVCLVTVIVGSTGCSSGSGGSGGTGLESALSRVADTAGNRTNITYDNTAELVRLAGKNPVSKNAFGQLRGWGVPAVAQTMLELPAGAGFDLFGEEYGISAGFAPKSVSLMAGGQSAAQITGHLTGLGWKNSGGLLVAPPPLKAGSKAGLLALDAAHVQAAGSDVVFGAPEASLSQIGSPTGTTLASDPRISALAQCLGNVVAAGIYSGGNLGGKKPAAVAVGVSQPASSTATPHAVVCVSWSTRAAATHFATELRKALAGLSFVQNRPYSDFLKHATVTTVGGSQHVVEWQADTPGNAQTVFQMVEAVGLPALPDCSRLTPLQRPRVTGCT
jgi:hypothetical protein